MWSTRLTVLGLVRWLGPVHGYLIRHELERWSPPESPNKLKAGSIYHALKKLTSDGLVEIVSTESVNDRPARTSYRITTAGERAFHTELRRQLWEFTPATDPFEAVWAFAPALGTKEAIAVLRERADALYGHIEQLTQCLANTTGEWESQDLDFMPDHARAMMRRRAEMLAVDATWCEETADRIANGEIDLGTDMNSDMSQQWREAIQHDYQKKSTNESV
ncbi:PadR family transcriptional regulator [Haloglycomyces albus]|uniref:PadR family transcriptional regulator n=1 Tax=Haloglycomyces albus TaxID=526067 RepID=UPI00046D673C|nr:PadR family transcriptional regulator [Haloglycomyces albus]